MRYWIAVCLTALGAIAGLVPALHSQPLAAAAPTTASTIRFDGAPVLQEAERIGINLGHWTSWGAEQLAANIIKNPGFEGIVDRALVVVTAPHNAGFTDDQRWLARPDHFWRGAGVAVLTGAAAGAEGMLVDSLASGASALPEYRLQAPIKGLAAGDIVALTLVRDDLPPSQWWFSAADSGSIEPYAGSAPASEGVRSVLLTPATGRSVTLYSHLDTISERAGKLLPVNGAWHFSVWAYAALPATLQTSFRRSGSAAFLNVTQQLEPGWQLIAHDFTARDDGPLGPLELALTVSGAAVALDEVWLGQQAPATTAAYTGFSPQVIALLQQLRPGYLRDWQGQLGDTLANRLAPASARRASRYRPGNPDYGYGLVEFVDLCRHVGAQPWLVLPTTFSPAEAETLGRWLRVRLNQDGFREVLVEFGNENWNAVFRPAGIQHAERHAEAADRVFAALRRGSGNDARIKTVLGAQHANPAAALKLARASSTADILAIAPYLLPRLNQSDLPAVMNLLFADDGGRSNQIVAGLLAGREAAVYEINLHTTRGDVPTAERDAIVTSAAAGSALARRLLQNLLAGIKRQNVYTLVGYDTFLQDSRELTRLFGISSDLAHANAIRPTGFAVGMLNRVISAKAFAGRVEGVAAVELTAAAFDSAAGWSAAIVSAAAQPRELLLQFPDGPHALPTTAHVLDGSTLSGAPQPLTPQALAFEQVGTRVLRLQVPAYSLVILQAKPSP